MNFIFLKSGVSYSLDTLFYLIEKKTETIIGCLLVDPDCPDWFIETQSEDNPAQKLYEYALKGGDSIYVTGNLIVYLIVREPGTLFQFTTFVCYGACNINFSGTGGETGKTLFKLLAEKNIKTHPSGDCYPCSEKTVYQMDSEEKTTYLIRTFWDGFDNVSRGWLNTSFGGENYYYT